jgi:hypothetical protein
MKLDATEAVDLRSEFPVESQTTDSDKLFLLSARRLVKDLSGSYSYVEIGSFLGGSLTPFLRDPACAFILSVDERERQSPDERGQCFDYSGVTAQTMLDQLRARGLDTRKLDTHDGSIDTLTRPPLDAFDIAFVDGEHTDEGCFRDFLWTLPLMKKDSLIMFHDSSFTYKAIKLINIYLSKLGLKFHFFKKRGSEMSAAIFGKYCALDLEHYFGKHEDLATFYAAAEAYVLKSQVKNRVRIGFGSRRLVTLKVKPAPVCKAY